LIPNEILRKYEIEAPLFKGGGGGMYVFSGQI
jgi:hypothetical protein